MPSVVGERSSASTKKVQSSKNKRKSKKKEDEAEKKAVEEAQEENETEFQKAVVEVRVNELETLNLGLKRKADYLESQNAIYKTQLQDVRTEKEELVGYFERLFKEEKATVKYLEEKVNALSQANLLETSSNAQTLLEKQLEFDFMKESLERQIQDLALQLTKLEDFSQEKDDLTNKLNKLEQNLAAERAQHILKFEELENDIIRYRERIKVEAVQTLVEISTDIQKAGKLCLSGAVKAAIAANVELKQALETVSKDNLTLRDHLELAAANLKNENAITLKLQRGKQAERKKSQDLISILKVVLEKQMQMDEKIKNISNLEEKVSKLEKAHNKCQSPEDIQGLIRFKTLKLEEEINRIKNLAKMSSAKEAEYEKFKSLILKLAITCKDLTEAQNDDEFEFLCQKLKIILGAVHEIASKMDGLNSETQSRLTITAWSVFPYFKMSN